MKTFILRIYLLSFLFINLFYSQSVNAQQPCSIAGPNSVPTGVYITYITTLTNINWETYSYNGADVQIFRYNLDTLVVNTGPTSGNFTVYVLSNPGKENLCSLNVTIDASLPIEMSTFTSQIFGRNVLLNWTTSSEENNSGFQIERSIVNGEWSIVGNIIGNGTTNIPHNYSFMDKNLISQRYNYRLKQSDFNGNFQYFDLQSDVVIGSPEKFALYQNYPNPFNPSTKINFDIGKDAFVKISLIDVSGKVIKTLVNEFRTAGYYSITFEANELAGGIYFCKLESGNFLSVRKIVLLK